MSDHDKLLAEADAYVGQGGPLVAALAAALRVLSERIVTVDLDGRTIRYDKVAECEAALDSAEVRAEAAEARLADVYAPTRLDALRALRREGYAVVDKEALAAAREATDRGVPTETAETGDGFNCSVWSGCGHAPTRVNVQPNHPVPRLGDYGWCACDGNREYRVLRVEFDEGDR